MTAWLSPSIRLALLGVALGATVSGVGLSDYGELHRMFTLRDLRLALAFGGALVIAGVGFAIHCRNAQMPARPLRRGTIPGALAFGAGWALCGGCPGAALVQLGEGRVAALVTLAGILAGMRVGQRIQGALRWDAGSCGS